MGGYCFSMDFGFQMSHHLGCPPHNNTNGFWHHANPYKSRMDLDLLMSSMYIGRQKPLHYMFSGTFGLLDLQGYYLKARDKNLDLVKLGQCSLTQCDLIFGGYNGTNSCHTQAMCFISAAPDILSWFKSRVTQLCSVLLQVYWF